MPCYGRGRCCEERSTLARVGQCSSVLLGGGAGTQRAVWESGAHLYGLQAVSREARGGVQGACSGEKLTGRSMPLAGRSPNDRLVHNSPDPQ